MLWSFMDFSNTRNYPDLLFAYLIVSYRSPCGIRSTPFFSVVENRNYNFTHIWTNLSSPLETWFIQAFYVHTNHIQLPYQTIVERMRYFSCDIDRNLLEVVPSCPALVPVYGIIRYFVLPFCLHGDNTGDFYNNQSQIFIMFVIGIFCC